MRLKKLFAALLISLITACSAFDSDDLGKHISDPMELTVGDIIRVVTVDIEDFQFRLTGITEQTIEGKDISIPFVEIRDIEIITPNRSSSEEISETTRVVLVIITAAGMILAPSSSGGGKHPWYE